VRVGSGAREVGQDGAFVAVADDGTAPNWHPAGLSKLWRPELSFAVDHFFSKQMWMPNFLVHHTH